MDSGGRSNAERSVATDGSRTRKKTECVLHMRKGARMRQLGWYRERNFVPSVFRLGFLFVKSPPSLAYERKTTMFTAEEKAKALADLIEARLK